MGIGAKGTKAALIGGFDPVLARVALFDATSGNWTDGADMPISACNLAFATVGHETFVFGGYDPGSVMRTVYVYDLDADTWRRGTDMPTARDRAYAAPLNGKIYVSGGQNYCSTQHRAVEAYDIAGDSWTTLPLLQQKRADHNLEVVGGTLYVLGGADQCGLMLSSVEAYKPGDAVWHYAAQLTGVPRDMAASAVCPSGRHVYLIGGRSATAASVADVDIYEP
jgi:N-acetylneuraminic acid mutarotase